MRRRKAILFLGGAALAWPLAALAQQTARPMRFVGVLMGYPESDLAAQSQLAAFRGELTKLGWTEGSNLRIELRWGAGYGDTIGKFAKELVELRPDAILGVTTPVVGALAHQTQTIPIVLTLVTDPVGNGFAASLTHPGGNITGFEAFDPAVAGKWVGLLKEIAPRTVRAAALFNPATASPPQLYLPSIHAAASSLAVEVSAAPVHRNEEIESVIATQASSPGGGLIVMPDVFNLTNRDLIIALAARYGVPAIYNASLYAESGGLISYGAVYVEHFRQAAGYIDRILKGAKPGELPIQKATRYELTINLKTAKALGLTLSSGLFSIADEVIE